jgi:hypothetical protein
MDDAEVAEVLALVAALDPYSLEVDDTIVDAWTLALPDVDGNHAKRAVIEHYRETGKRISIADVITRSREIEIRDRTALRHEALRQRRETDRAALPAPAPRRDRIQDVAGLLAQHRNWSPVGDLSVRRKQASWSPALEQAYRRAVAAKAAEERESDGTQAPAPE